MKQEPTDAAHDAAVGIPAVHGREDVKKLVQACWVDVVYSEGDSTVESILDNAGIQQLACNFNNGPGIDVRTHTKFWLIDGDYNGDITPRVYTGSHNWTGSGLRSADEAMVRITSADYHAEYLSYFYKIRDTCREHMG